MEEVKIKLETALSAKDKGFYTLDTSDTSCFCIEGEWNDDFSFHKLEGIDDPIPEKEFLPELCFPTQSLLQKWLREVHNIDVYPMPVFREKVGYDTFKRDGYTFEIVRKEPATHLTWSDFNVCGEDRDEEIREEGELTCLRPSVETYEEALEIGLLEALNLINK